ncbi:MAG: Gfo/Idh/MocA family oxidoreductase [Candidatus Micrarchaeota archaeon]
MLALIGLGYWGKNYYSTLTKLGKRCLLRYIYDSNEKLRGKYSGEKIIFAKSIDEILKDDSVKGVIIATPPATHFKIAKACLLAGKNVLVEKPCTGNLKKAMELKKISNTIGRQLLVGNIFLFDDCVKRLKTKIKKQKIKFVSIKRLLTPKREDADILLDVVFHDLYLTNYLFDKNFKAKHAFITKKFARQFDYAHITLSNGPTIVCIEAGLVYPKKVRELLLVSDKKSFFYDQNYLTEYKNIFSEQIPRFKLLSKTKNRATPLENECINFKNAILGGKDNYKTLHYALISLQKIKEIRKLCHANTFC